MHRWKPEEVEYLREISKGRYKTEIVKMVNEKFGLNLSFTQVKSKMDILKIRTGVNTKYQKGHTPWNPKGTKRPGFSNKGSFKKGHVCKNKKPVGTERINRDGYIEIKAANPSTWKLKHRLIWEEHYGPIPKNHVIIFADGNKLNLDINNLIMVTNAELMRINQNGLYARDAEITKTGVLVAKLIVQTFKKEKENGNIKLEDT